MVWSVFVLGIVIYCIGCVEGNGFCVGLPPVQESSSEVLEYSSYGSALISFQQGNDTCEAWYYRFPRGLYMGSDPWLDHVNEEVPYRVTVRKEHDDSYFKVQINTEWQCQGENIGCRWEVLLNGYSCIPPLYHEIFSSPNGEQRFRDTFTGYCNQWEYGGGRPLFAGEYNVTLLHYALESFSGPRWKLPDGTKPHGGLPIQQIGLPRLGGPNERFHIFQVLEEVETPLKTIHHETRTFNALGHDQSIENMRTFQFTKQNGGSHMLKITLYDNFRCFTRQNVGHNIPVANGCEFEILIDGESCADPGPIVLHFSVNSRTNYNTGKTLIGICTGISAGSHELSVSMTGSGEPSLGRFSTTGTISVEEIPISQLGTTIASFDSSCLGTADPPFSIPCFPFIEPVRRCIFGCRTWTFNKPTTSSGIRLEWFDNVRCRSQGNANGNNCQFEVLIDDMHCTDPGPMMMDLIDDNSRNAMYTGFSYIGFCREWDDELLSAGTHSVKIWYRNRAQNTNDDQCRSCVYNGIRPEVGTNTHAFMEITFYEPEQVTTSCVETED